MSFKHFQLENPVASTRWDEQNSPIQNLDYFEQLISDLSILDICMYWIHTCVCRNM